MDKIQNKKQIVKLNTTQRFAMSVLTLSILALSQAHALQVLSDQALREIEGQDGFNAEINFTEANIDKVEWVDQAGKPGRYDTGEMGLAASYSGINISRGDLAADQQLGSKLSLDVYSGEQSNGGAGIHFNMENTLGKVTVDKVQVCSFDTGCGPDEPSMGSLEIESYQPMVFNLLTTNGLFNKNSKSFFDLSLQNARVGIKHQTADGQSNMLSMEHLNINISTLSYLSIDPENGITLTSGADGFADFIRDEVTGRPGINIEFAVNNNGLIRAGANGRMMNGLVQLGSSASQPGMLGKANQKIGDGSAPASQNDIAGSSGIRFKLAGEFTNDTDKLGANATSLELGGAGTYAYGLRFENITALRTRSNISGTERDDRPLTSERAGLDMDGMYINMVNSHQILLPENQSLKNIFMGANTGDNAKPMTTSADYMQIIGQTGSINPNSAVLSLRAVDFVALSRRGQFIATPDVTDPSKLPSTEAAKWGLGLPIHNLNSNFAFYAKKSDGVTDFIASKNQDGVPILTPVSGSDRVGFSASISTQGVNNDGSKSTSILLIDGADNTNYANGVITPTDYYVGLRNIDMLLNGYGSIGFEDGRVNVSLPDLKMIVAAQFAAGYLPGAKFKSCPVSGGCYAPSNSFSTNNDVLAGFKLRLEGGINFALVPRTVLNSQDGLVDGVNAMNIVGIMRLNPNKLNAIQIVDSDGSTIGFDNLRGAIGFDNNIIVNKNNIGFHYSFVFNPNKKKEDVFRIKDLNLYSATTTNGNTTVSNGRRLGEIAITGGRINAEMTITPRDTPFVF